MLLDVLLVATLVVALALLGRWIMTIWRCRISKLSRHSAPASRPSATETPADGVEFQT